MAELEMFLNWSLELTVGFRVIAFAVVAMTFGYASVRLRNLEYLDSLRNCLVWVAVLTAAFVATGPITAFNQHLSLYTRATTTPILAILVWHCIQYLRRDPPSIEKLFRRTGEGR